MALKLNCLEPLTAIAIGVGACAMATIDVGLVAGGFIGGAGLFTRIRENARKAGLDDAALTARMQASILRDLGGHWQATQALRDTLTESDAAMTRLLPQVMLTRAELAAATTQSAGNGYPKVVAQMVVDRLASLDAMFAAPASGSESSLHRRFAIEAIERSLRIAMEDKEYAVLLTLEIVIGLGHTAAETRNAVDDLGRRVDEGIAALQQSFGSEIERLSVRALRGAVARFLDIRPNASTSEVVDAVEAFIPEYEALTERVRALDAHDNRVKGLQQAATAALYEGDLDAACRLLAEAADVRVDTAKQAVRDAAATLDELARARLLALDCSAAESAWAQAAAILMPVEVEAAEGLIWRAAWLLQEHGEVFAKNEAIHQSVNRWRTLHQKATQRGEPELGAVLANNLGNALKTLGERSIGENGLRQFEEAVCAYRDALSVFTQSTSPIDWAQTQNNLGNVLLAQSERAPGADWSRLADEAISAYRKALMVRTKLSAPVDWATTQNNLGNALRAKAGRGQVPDRLQLIVEAVTAFRSALTVFTRCSLPSDWALATFNLGVALVAQGELTAGPNGSRLLDEAARVLRDALAIRTRRTRPAEWALTKFNLGSALALRGKRTEGLNGIAFLNEAVSTLREALTVCTVTAMPTLWVTTQCNLATALAALGRRTGGTEGVRDLSESINAFREALSVLNFSTMPTQWAAVQNNLGTALLTQAKWTSGVSGLRLLGEAIIAWRNALTIHTESTMPVQWAATMANIGGAHEVMADLGDAPRENLIAAELALHAALTTFTAEQMPQDHQMATEAVDRIRIKLQALGG